MNGGYFMARTRAERRKSRVKAIKHGEDLMKNLGPKKGRVHKKQVAKISENSGYFDGGEISQYVETKATKKLRENNGSEPLSPRDERQMLDSVDDYDLASDE